jgi:hypothetical protein
MITIAYEDNKPLIYMDVRGEYFQCSFKDEMGRVVNELGEFLDNSSFGREEIIKKGVRQANENV